MIEVHQNFKVYDPPRWVVATVERLLTDSAAVGRGKTGRIKGRKYARNECRGFYHAERRGEPAWIELVVDNIRDMIIGNVLYHEIGHHLHATIGSASSGGEESADDWSRRLNRVHFRKHYWYLRPVVRTLAAGFGVYRWFRKRGKSAAPAASSSPQ